MLIINFLCMYHLVRFGTAQDQDPQQDGMKRREQTDDRMAELDRLLSSLKDAYEATKTRTGSDDYYPEVPYTLDISASINPEVITAYESWESGTLHTALFPKNPFFINRVIHNANIVWEAAGEEKCFVTLIEPLSKFKFLSLQIDNGTGHCMRILFEKRKHTKYTRITRDIYEKRMNNIMSREDEEPLPRGRSFRRTKSERPEEEDEPSKPTRRSSFRAFFQR